MWKRIAHIKIRPIISRLIVSTKFARRHREIKSLTIVHYGKFSTRYYPKIEIHEITLTLRTQKEQLSEKFELSNDHESVGNPEMAKTYH